MAVPTNITRRALLALTSAFALLPLAGCDAQTEAETDGATVEPSTGPKGDDLLIPSDHSAFEGNAAWCAPMQICWDILEDEYNDGNPVPEDGHPQMVADLNNGSFDPGSLGEDHYVSYSGPATTAAKSEIEQLIDERFDQKSDILDMIQWSDDPLAAVFIIYCMLYRQFTFGLPFDVLDPAPFGSEVGGNLCENVAYFGFDASSDWDIKDQVTPLFWESDDRFAVRIECTEGDVVYLARGAEGSTFDEMWSDVHGSIDSDYVSGMAEVTTFACPKLNVDVLAEYKDLENVSFTNAEGEPYTIGQALQTLKFKLDETGGTIKSEAVIALYGGGPDDTESHEYRFDDTFVLFLVDGNVANSYPYAGLLVQNMEDYLAQ